MTYQRSIFVASLAVVALHAACKDDKRKPESSPGDAGNGTELMDARVADARVTAGDSSGGSIIVPDARAVVGDGGGSVSDGAVAPTDAGNPVQCDASAAPTLPALKLEDVPGVGTLAGLVFAAQPPGSSDWYLVQQTGHIRVLVGGALRAGDFLDVSAQISISLDMGDERGLLGLAFAPDYAQSGKFYVMMSPTKSGNGQTNADRDVVLEYQRSAADPYVADPATLKTLLRLDTSAPNHNGGNVLFGPDGFLYVGTGDGGGGCSSSKPGASQDLNSPFGKILRLDPKAAAPAYAAAGNPFASGGDARVFHYGLRNPFRFGFDRATGDLYIGDVGQDRYEEVDFVAAGAKGLNFGWPKYEGDHVDTCAGAPNLMPANATHTKPIVDINRQMGAPPPFGDYRSVIGGPVYRGSAIPQLRGVSLFGDYVGVRMGALVQCGAGTSPVLPFLKKRNANTPNVPGFSGSPTLSLLVGIVEDNAGELYLVANRNTLLKVVPGP